MRGVLHVTQGEGRTWQKAHNYKP